MVDTSRIAPHMEVLDATGAHVGTVDRVDGSRIKLTRSDSADHAHHHVPLTAVARVDRHVHLSVTRAAALAGDDAGPGAVGGGGGGSARRYLTWLLIAIGLVLVFLVLRSCGARDETATGAPPPGTAVGAVALPGGGSVDLAPRSLNAKLQRYLASNDPAPRTFIFDELNFDTGLASIRPGDIATVATLAQILAAYPQARVRLVGYADARGAVDANADLGRRRAAAVGEALIARNIAAGRVEMTSGGETNPAGSNATDPGRLENRRTELVVLAK